MARVCALNGMDCYTGGGEGAATHLAVWDHGRTAWWISNRADPAELCKELSLVRGWKIEFGLLANLTLVKL